MSTENSHIVSGKAAPIWISLSTRPTTTYLKSPSHDKHYHPHIQISAKCSHSLLYNNPVTFFTFSFFNIFALFSASQALPPKWTSTAFNIHEPRSTSSHIHDPFWAFPQLDEHAVTLHNHRPKILSLQFLTPSGRDVKPDAHHGRVPETEEDSKTEHNGWGQNELVKATFHVPINGLRYRGVSQNGFQIEIKTWLQASHMESQNRAKEIG